jgi:hypothetical protein
MYTFEKGLITRTSKDFDRFSGQSLQPIAHFRNPARNPIAPRGGLKGEVLRKVQPYRRTFALRTQPCKQTFAD